MTRFNSATASPPWMTTGHGGRIHRCRRCFNSATASPPWMTPGMGICKWRSIGGFNSATASPPWMTFVESGAWKGVLSELQFGHSVAAVDDQPRSPRRRPQPLCFNSATASPPWMTTQGADKPLYGG